MTQVLEQLTTLLRNDLENLKALNHTLGQEHRALESNNADSLTALSSEKEQLLAALRQRARQKVRLLVELGFRPDLGSPSAFLVKQAVSPELLGLWQKAQTGLEICQRQNSVNGRIISHMQRRLARMADILRGNDRSQRLYGSAGETRNLNHNSVLASV
ncbi:MAG: flagellar protein FlgN [Halomonadaceae bacterium]|nr:MAG: flagellar protein FlgN [Halomonadaceae bacterium]